MNCLTIDVEEWFHILNSDVVPGIDAWPTLTSRVAGSVEQILDLLSTFGVKATFFWLGWVAHRNKSLLRRCLQDGHEIASHGYAHLLAYEVGESGFRQDITRAKACLEDITGTPVVGFRAAGFSVTRATPWAFDIIREAGYLHDSSVFPARRGHGGVSGAPIAPYFIKTKNGVLFEAPASVVQVLGYRVSFFGGGYLRLVPKRMLEWGTMRVTGMGRPLVVYFHPRDIDPGQPRLSLPTMRKFKCYVNLHTTLAKIKWLCENYRFDTMCNLMDEYLSHPPVETAVFRPKTHMLPKAALEQPTE